MNTGQRGRPSDRKGEESLVESPSSTWQNMNGGEKYHGSRQGPSLEVVSIKVIDSSGPVDDQIVEGLII